MIGDRGTGDAYKLGTPILGGAYIVHEIYLEKNDPNFPGRVSVHITIKSQTSGEETMWKHLLIKDDTITIEYEIQPQFHPDQADRRPLSG